MPSGEEWSVNPVWGLQDFGTDVSQAQCVTVATAVAAVNPGTNMLTYMAPGTQLSAVRVEGRTRAGLLAAQAEVNRAGLLNGSGSVVHPFQTSAVISLRTAQVGASGRGRLYWPATGVVCVSNSNRPATATVDAFVAAAKVYLNAIQTAVRVTFPGSYLAVWSRKQNALFSVNQIQSGDVLDVQRRRRDVLLENYSSVTYP